MSETIVLAAIAFCSAMVTLVTAVFGYFQVLVPMRQDRKTNGDRHHEISARVALYESRIESLEGKIARLEQTLEMCEQARLDLKKDNYKLLAENAELLRRGN